MVIFTKAGIRFSLKLGALGLEKKPGLYTKSDLTEYLTPYSILYPDSFVLQMYDPCVALSIWQATNDS